MRQDLIYAFRAFRRTPGFSLVAVIVIALGIGANTATFSIANALLFRPVSDSADRLVSLHSRSRSPQGDYKLFSYPAYDATRNATGMFDGVAAHLLTLVSVTDGTGERPRALAAVVSSSYFDTLGVRLAAGRPFALEEERPGAANRVAIASHARWARTGFDPAIVGSRITINASEYTIIGIAPAGFTGSLAMLSPDVFLPLGVFETVVSDRFKNDGRGLADPSTEGLAIVARLKAGDDVSAVTARLDVVARQLEAAYPDAQRDQTLVAHPLSRFSAGPAPQDNTAIGTVSGLLLTLSMLVLVIACLNIANMLLARGAARRKELAVRLSIGAVRRRVVRQLLTESLLLATAGAALGLLFGTWIMAILASSLSSALPFDLAIGATPDSRVVAATVGVAAVATLAFGLGPALTLSRRNLVVDLKERGTEGAASVRWFSTRNLLVVGQVALSLALLTAGGIFTRTAIASASRTPGFSYDQLLVASTNTTLAGMDEARGSAAQLDVLERVRAIPGVMSATLTSTIPFGESIDSARFEPVAETGREPVRARAYRIIGADYFRTLGLSMIRGREFTQAEAIAADAPPVAIVDLTFARQLFGDTDPVGQFIRLAPPAGDPSAAGVPLEIVGVAPPLYEELLETSPPTHVYVPTGRNFRATMHLHARLAPGVDEAGALAAVREAMQAVDPRMPIFALSTFRSFHDRGFELLAMRGSAAVFTGLGALALVLSVVGVYGLRSYIVSQRTHEIGIRMALGAGRRQVMGMMVRDGLKLTSAGILMGLPLAIALAIGFRSIFVDVGGFDALVLTSATAALGLAALAASLIPARRAARIEPLTALRNG